MNVTEKEFEKIVREHKDTIYTVCFMFSNDKDEVQDMFQEVLINMWQGLDKFNEKSALSTWIWRVSLNSCISMDRKKQRKATVPLTMDVDFFNDKDADAAQVRLLYDRIHRLKAFDRAIVLLWLESLSYDEIGSIVGISAKAVSVRLFRIRQELKNMSNN